MTITVLQEHLIKALTRVGKTVSIKANLPVLQHIYMSASEGTLTVATTNLETTTVYSFGGKVDKEGSICVPAKVIQELVATLPQGKVTLEEKEGQLFVTSAGTSASIPGMSGSEFPPLPEKKSKKTIGFGKTILEAIPKVLFAAASDEGRPILTGVKFQPIEGGLLLAATDGYRLSVKRIEGDVEITSNMIVPARALMDVVHIVKEDKTTTPVTLSLGDDGQLGFSVGDTDIYTRLIEGEFPNFEKIIPKTATTTATIARESLLRAIKSAAIFARDNANIVKLHIAGSTLTIAANTPQVGQNSVDVDISLSGGEADIAFNSRFLLDFFANFEEEQVVFEMTGTLNPGVFHPINDETYLHIIMPVRVQG